MFITTVEGILYSLVAIGALKLRHKNERSAVCAGDRFVQSREQE